MIRHDDEMKIGQTFNKMGGDGYTLEKEVVPSEYLVNARFFKIITLKEGCSIGPHTHNGEIEYYYILNGKGIVTESDGEKPVSKGDVIITGWGQTHAIRNTEKEDLSFVAFISTESK